ncbi:MAG TPA: GntR family transcriptional regulator [Novosphingobium sp.]|nr:GntR family transcriptional regulator [Novosphingobium sp.]
MGKFWESDGAIRLDKSLPTPLYHQIFSVLQEAILRGQVSADSTLPSQQEIARLFGVSEITAKRALNELVLAGLITRHRGRGNFVKEQVAIPVVNGSFHNVIESLAQLKTEKEVALIEVIDVAISTAVAEKLALAPGAIAQRATRVRTLSGAPYSYFVAYVPQAIAMRYDAAELRATPMLALLEHAGHAAFDAEQWITAIPAPPQVAANLSIAPDSPLLKIDTQMRDRDGTPIQFIEGYYHPLRFQYNVKHQPI